MLSWIIYNHLSLVVTSVRSSSKPIKRSTNTDHFIFQLAWLFVCFFCLTTWLIDWNLKRKTWFWIGFHLMCFDSYMNEYLLMVLEPHTCISECGLLETTLKKIPNHVGIHCHSINHHCLFWLLHEWIPLNIWLLNFFKCHIKICVLL